MRVLELRLRSNGKPLRGFADIELNDGTIVREFRIIQEQGKRAFVACPQISWKDPATERVRYSTIITFPSQLKGELDLLILSAWNRAKEKEIEYNSQ